MHYAKIAQKLRDQIVRFSGELSSGLPKVCRRFVMEMIYGIQARQSVRLTEVARSLGETISLKKTHERLCRQLGKLWLGIILTDTLLRMGSERIRESTLLVLDISDVSKKYAEKMEYMGRVRDGSEGTLAKGYWMLNVVGTEVGEARIIPLYSSLYSQEAPEFRSENRQIERAIEKVSQFTQRRGIWVLDRGGDRRELIDFLLNRELRFIIRARSERSLISEGEKIAILDLALSCPMIYMERIVKEDQGQERLLRLEFGSRRVHLPWRKESLFLVVVRGFGEEPMMLLTNLEIRRSRSSLWRVIESYLTRWRVEETIRFLKQSYKIEDIRLLTYTRLQNMMVLVTAVAYFATVYLGMKTKLRLLARHVLQAARRLFGIPDFRFYALADGIREFLFSLRTGPQSPTPLLKVAFEQKSLFDS